MPDTETVLRTVLDEWKAGIDDHDPGRAAAAFTEDAIFQGLKPYGVGRDAVFAYYDGQPAGLRVEYSFLESRRLSDTVLLGYLQADFTFADGSGVSLNLGVVVTETAEGWRVAQYQVSARPE
ncbi:SgcJ/EcaC family oxidoreductase [Mycobacterium sp. NPDC003323]